MRILIAEDNTDNRDMLVRRLERRGHEVHAVGNGLEAVESAHALAPDLILMDLSMPVMSGLEATRALRSHKAMRAIKVIVLTAHAMPDVRQECLEAGCDAFATKPVDFPGLLATIEAVAGPGFAKSDAA